LARSAVVLGVVGSAVVAGPTGQPGAAAADSGAAARPAAAPVACQGGFQFGSPSGRFWLPTEIHGFPDGRDCTMRRGYMNNWGVVVLQRALQRCYGQRIAIDGDFGPATAAALRNAQRLHHLAVDSVYGPRTRLAMHWPTGSSGRCVHHGF
jgi:peptidoglycan hydrolase-like protein with peptidoglycan-binding domain